MAFNLNLGALTVALGLDADKFNKGVKEAKSSWGSLKGDLGSLGKGLGAGAALAAGGVALVAKAAADLETELTKAAAVSQGGMANFADFKAAALDASSGSAASAKQAGESLKYLAMAGFSAQEAMTALPETIRLASAAGVDLGRSADIASDILSGFGLKAKDLGHANDVLVLGFTRTNTTLELLAESMKYIGPAAQSTGQSIETMTAAVGLMANVGVKGSQAGTSMRMAMLRMIDPPKKAREALTQLGVEIVDQQGKMRDFVDIIGDLERAQTRFGKADFASKISKVVGVEAVSGILGIINQGEGALRSLRDEMVAAKDTTKNLEAQMLQTFGGQFAIAQGNVENLAAIVGDAFLPILKELSAWLTQTAVALQKDQEAQAAWSAQLTDAMHMVGGLVEMMGVLGQVMAFGLGIVMEVVTGWRLLVGAIDLVIQSMATLIVYMATGNKAQLEADEKIIQQMTAKLDALGELGDQMAKANKLGDAFAGSSERVAEILQRSTITISSQNAQLRDQAAAAKAAEQALRDYGKQWRFANEGANFVESPRWMLGPESKAGKDAGKDTRTAPKTDRDAKKRAAEEAAAAKIRERVAQMELDARRESYDLTKIDMEAQAAIEGLKLRQLGVVERELEIAKIIGSAEAQKVAYLEKQTEELEKQEKLHQKAMSAILGAGVKGATTGQSVGIAVPKGVEETRAKAADEEKSERQRMVAGIMPIMGLMDGFADMLGEFGAGLKSVLKIGSAALEGFAEGGALGALQGGLTALAGAVMDTISQSQVFQDNLAVLGSLFEGIGIGDLVDSFFESFQPAIGAIVSVFQGFAGAGFDGMFEGLGRSMFSAVKGILQGFLFIKKVFAYAEYGITSAVFGISSVINSLVNKIAGWIDNVPGFDRPDTSWINDFNRAREKDRNDAGTALDAITAQQDSLADLTYESAQAIYDETLERNKSTESIKELNDELKNAPAGIKLALARFNATDGVGGQGGGGGGGQYTTMGQVMIVANDPATFMDVLKRKQFVRTGSSQTMANQMLTRGVVSKL